MRVKDLIQKLQQRSPDEEVFLSSDEYPDSESSFGMTMIRKVERVTILSDRGNEARKWLCLQGSVDECGRDYDFDCVGL